MTFWNTLAYNNRASWNENANLNINTFTGEAAASTIKASFSCNNGGDLACMVNANNTSWKLQTEFVPATTDADYTGAQSFGSPGTSTDYQTFAVTLMVENSFAPPAFDTIGPTAGAGTQRCDSASYINNGGGCSYYEYPFNFFTLSLSDPTVGQAAQTDQDGQMTLPGNPGWYGHGSVLTRDTNQADMQANRAAACKGVPPSCDEYPYASTHQGAAFGPVIARSISASQNSKEGSLLSSFFLTNRIGEADPFYVNITS